MTNVLTLTAKPTARDEIRAEVVGYLKEALAQAEAGNVDEIMVIMKHPGDDEWSNYATQTHSFAQWIGYLTIHIADWMAAYKQAHDQ